MTPALAAALERAGRLLTYPAREYVDDIDRLTAAVEPVDPAAAAGLAAFADSLRGRTVEALQELYTQTFDMNPVCALEVGWHLFGEDYERGAFLVRMREALRARDIDEGSELPDHLASMLQLAARSGPADADPLITRALLPATAKILENLQAADSPFVPLLAAVRAALTAAAPAVPEVHHA